MWDQFMDEQQLWVMAVDDEHEVVGDDEDLDDDEDDDEDDEDEDEEDDEVEEE
jgi:hypothetical protein